MEKLKGYLKNKKLGYYFVMAISLFALVELIIYLNAFLDPQWESYYDSSVVIFSAIAFVVGAASLCYKNLSRWGAGLSLLFSFLAFLMFNRYGYWYYSQIFFGGIEFALILQMYYGYLFIILISLVIFGLGIASCFMKHDASEEG